MNQLPKERAAKAGQEAKEEEEEEELFAKGNQLIHN